MYKDVGKRILAVMLCICMLAGMGAVSDFSSRATGTFEDTNVSEDTGESGGTDALTGSDPGTEAAALTGSGEGDDAGEAAGEGADPAALSGSGGGADPAAAADTAGTVTAELLQTYNAGRYDGKPYEIPMDAEHLRVLRHGTNGVEELPVDQWNKIVYLCNGAPLADGVLPRDAGVYYFQVDTRLNGMTEPVRFLYIRKVDLDSVYDIYWPTLDEAKGFPVQDTEISEAEAMDLVKNGKLITGIDHGMEERELELNTDYTIESVAPAGASDGFSKPGSIINVTLVGVGNYTSKKTVQLRVLYKDFPGTNITSLGTISFDEKGSRTELAHVTKDLQIKVDGKVVADFPDDYEVSYYRDRESAENGANPIRDVWNMRDVGEYYFRLSGKNSRAEVRSFRIVRYLDFDNGDENPNFDVTLEQYTYPYTGQAHRPAVTVTETYTDSSGSDHIRTLIPDTDYTVTYENNIEVGNREAYAIVRGIGNYASEFGRYCGFTIEKIDLSKTNSRVTVEIEQPVEYNPSGGQPTIEVYYQAQPDAERSRITEDLNFEFKNGANPLGQVGETSVKITPKDGKKINYMDTSREETFMVSARSLTNPEITVTIDSKSYDGVSYRPEPVVSDGGRPLRKGTDYDYTPVEATGAGKGTIVLRGIGNYCDTKEVEFDITAAPLDNTNTRITLSNGVYEYTGSVLIPSGEVKVEYNKDPSNDQGWILLHEGEGRDYVIVPAGGNTEAGDQATIRIEGRNNYSGYATAQYTISPRDISDKPDSKIDVYLEGAPFYYTGEVYQPAVSLRFSSIEDYNLVEGTDYTVKYEPTSTVKQPGKIIITGIGNFEGTREVEYRITPQDLGNGQLEVRIREKDGDNVGVPVGDKLFPYNGNEVIPFAKNNAILNYHLGNGNVVRLDSGDCTISYENNIDIGTAFIVITAKEDGNYQGTARIPFKIRGSLGDQNHVKVTLKKQSYTGSPVVLDGNLIESATFTYEDGTVNELRYGVDFELVAVRNQEYKEVGRAQVLIRSLPDGDYTGEGKVFLTIEPRDLGSEGIHIEVRQHQTYRGYAFTPEEIKKTVTVTYTNESYSETLTEDQFEVVFGSETNATDATGENGTPIIIRAVGNNNNFGGENTTEGKLVIDPLNIQDVIQSFTLKTNDYLMTADPVVLTRDDFTLRLKDEFKTAYKDAYKQVTGGDEAAADKQLTALGKAIKNDSAISMDATPENADPSIEELEYTSVGENALYLHGKGNYTGTMFQSFTIKGDLTSAANSGKAYVTYRHKGQDKNYYANGTDILEAYYIGAGVNVEPSVEVYYLDKKLTAGTDYNITYDNPQSDLTTGTPYPVIKIKGAGLLEGGFEVPYQVVPCDLTDTDYVRSFIRVDGLDHVVYTGKDQADTLKGQVKVRNIAQGGNAEITGLEIDITNALNGHQSSSSCAESNYANCPTVRVTGDGTYYTGTLVRYFDIIGIDLNEGYTIRVESLDANNNPMEFLDTYAFTGEVIAPKVAVWAEPNESNEADTSGGRYLVEGQDFNVIYRNSARREVKPLHAGDYTIVVVGKNNYSGNVEQTYSITPKSIHDTGIYITIEEVPVYAGGDIVKPVVRIVDTKRQDHGAPVNVSLYAALASTREDTYYRLVDQTENPDSYDYSMAVSAGMGSYNNTDAYAASNKQGIAQILAANDYQGSCYTSPYRIGQYHLENGITVEGLDGVDQTYTGQPIEPTITVKMGDKVILPEKGEYTVQYENNMNAGTATVAIVGADKNLTGSYSTTFSIAKRNFAEVTVEMGDTCPVNSDGAAEPKPIVRDGAAVLKEGTDYDLTYRNNTSVGLTGAVTIKGKGNYTDYAIVREFTVVAGIDLSELSVTVEPQKYTGQPVEPKVVLQLSDRTLTEGIDYILSYENNTEPGTATLIITGIGAYGGTKIVNFEILPEEEEPKNMTITPPGAAYMYTGAAIQPIVAGSVTSGSTVLAEGTDYEVTYRNNVNVGTATVTVTGKGKYAGTQTFTFQIIGRPMALCQVSGVGDVTYNGSNATPSVSVTDNGRRLTENTDYTLLYLNNEKPGEGRVLINGQGNYSGCKVVTFNIRAAGVSNVSARANGTRVTLSWNGASAVTGYEIWDSNQRLARTGETSYTISGLNPGTTYQYRVRSYTIRSGQVFYSSFVSVTVSTN